MRASALARATATALAFPTSAQSKRRKTSWDPGAATSLPSARAPELAMNLATAEAETSAQRRTKIEEDTLQMIDTSTSSFFITFIHIFLLISKKFTLLFIS